MARYPFVLSLLLAGLLLGLTSCKNQYLTGSWSRQAYIDSVNWRKPVRTGYSPDAAYLDSIQAQDSFDVLIFAGSWCNSSRRWMSRFFAYDSLLPIRDLEILSVDTTKIDRDGRVFKHRVDSIPTFIFFRDSVELGRVEVKPHRRKLEKAIWEAVKGQ